MKEELWSTSIIEENEVTGKIQEVFYGNTLQRLEEMKTIDEQETRVTPMDSLDVGYGHHLNTTMNLMELVIQINR